MNPSRLHELRQDGFCFLRAVFSAAQMDGLAAQLAAAFAANATAANPSAGRNGAVLESRGRTYGSRDLIRLAPQVAELALHAELRSFLASVLGDGAGLVRALFFDKPPGRSWSLPWHKDRTIAVENNGKPSTIFSKPTTKAGIAHVEAPEWLLAEMLTLRVHLDDMTADNGPLSVIAGSHAPSEDSPAAPTELHAAVGDVLAMRPLISHSSSLPRASVLSHRRIVHLEFSPRRELPDDYTWQTFLPLG